MLKQPQAFQLPASDGWHFVQLPGVSQQPIAFEFFLTGGNITNAKAFLAGKELRFRPCASSAGISEAALLASLSTPHAKDLHPGPIYRGGAPKPRGSRGGGGGAGGSTLIVTTQGVSGSGEYVGFFETDSNGDVVYCIYKRVRKLRAVMLQRVGCVDTV